MTRNALRSTWMSVFSLALIGTSTACTSDPTELAGPRTEHATRPHVTLDPPEPWDEASDPVLAVNNFAPGTPSNNPRIQIPSGFANYDCESMYYVIIGEMGKIISYSRAFNKQVKSIKQQWGLNFSAIATTASIQRFDIISAAMDFGNASIIFTNFGCLDIYENTLGPVYVAAARRAESEYFQWAGSGFSGPAPWVAWFPASMNGF